MIAEVLGSSPLSPEALAPPPPARGTFVSTGEDAPDQEADKRWKQLGRHSLVVDQPFKGKPVSERGKSDGELLRRQRKVLDAERRRALFDQLRERVADAALVPGEVASELSIPRRVQGELEEDGPPLAVFPHRRSASGGRAFGSLDPPGQVASAAVEVLTQR